MTHKFKKKEDRGLLVTHNAACQAQLHNELRDATNQDATDVIAKLEVNTGAKISSNISENVKFVVIDEAD